MKFFRSGLLLALLPVVAGLALVSCGSGDSGKADAGGTDRQARLLALDTELCVGDQIVDSALTITYENSTDSNGNGPFPLRGNRCARNPQIIAGNVTDPNGTILFRIAAFNPEIGRPDAKVVCRPGSKTDPDYGFKSENFGDPGVTHTYTCNPYTITITRDSDSAELKHFQAWVQRG